MHWQKDSPQMIIQLKNLNYLKIVGYNFWLLPVYSKLAEYSLRLNAPTMNVCRI